MSRRPPSGPVFTAAELLAAGYVPSVEEQLALFEDAPVPVEYDAETVRCVCRRCRAVVDARVARRGLEYWSECSCGEQHRGVEAVAPYLRYARTRASFGEDYAVDEAMRVLDQLDAARQRATAHPLPGGAA